MRILIPAEPDDFAIGTGIDSDAILRGGITGLGSPDYNTPTSPRFLTDGVAGGRQLAGARTLELDAFVLDPAKLVDLAALMGPRPDPTDVYALTLENVIVPGNRYLFVRPDGYDWLYNEDTYHELTGEEEAPPLPDRSTVTGLRLIWLAEDPVIYGAATVETGTTITVENVGTHATRSGRSWTLEITASGTVINPYVQIASSTSTKRVNFPLTLSTGQVLTVTEDRQTYVGSERVSGIPYTPGEPGPDWGILYPGENTVTLGADSGSFGVEFTWRSTWL